MAYPVDPGRTVTWAKHPEWEQELVSIIAALPRDDQIIVFAPATHRSAQWRRDKQDLLQAITADLFDAHGDPDKAAKQVASVQRKLSQYVASSLSVGLWASVRWQNTDVRSPGLLARRPARVVVVQPPGPPAALTSRLEWLSR